MPDIVLTTLNARFIHTGIGLRYLYANLEEIREHTTILEFTITDRVQDVAEKILAQQPRIVGIGVYIWNGAQVEQLIRIIKAVSPETILVLGGPEVSHAPYRLNLEPADYIVEGEGELSFRTLCRNLLAGNAYPEKIIPSAPVDLNEINMPYDHYTDQDVEHRVMYVEASRGCPFSCEFCLSSIDKKVRYFDLEAFLNALETLWQRGGRNFKFIDRTFNINLDHVAAVLDFFLEKEPPFLVHFEVIPEYFPQSVKERLQRFQPGTLQLEVGIQTLNPEVARAINRRLDMEKIRENLLFLEERTKAHLHVDLIIGLPGESAESFGTNLNTLAELTHAEIQLGVLKKLSGTTLNRHDEVHGMVYSPYPPYEILKNDLIDFEKMQQLKRLARFWDLVHNSGNFKQTMELIRQGTTTYEGFLDFSGWLYAKTHSTWQISLKRMAELLFSYLHEHRGLPASLTADTIGADISGTPGRSLPPLIRQHMQTKPGKGPTTAHGGGPGKRQQRHLT